MTQEVFDAEDHAEMVTNFLAGPHECERCGERLNPETMVWLELSNTTGRYHAEGAFPAEEVSQGCFTFGAACARTVLKSGGVCNYIGVKR